MPTVSVVVASENPIKKQAARDAYWQVFFPETKKNLIESAAELLREVFNPDDVTITGVATESGVHVQPKSQDETVLGARNRLNAIRLSHPDADCWVAIEGGVIIRDDGVFEIGCVIVSHKGTDLEFVAHAPQFQVPTKTAALIRDGWEMGPANDHVFGMQNSKQAGGMAGVITDNLVIRYDLYYTPLLIAMSQLKNNHLYGEH